MDKMSFLKLSLLFSIIFFSCNSAPAQTSVFTYQGKLTDTSAAANGQYDFTFKLFDAASNGTQIGADVFLDNVQVSGGIFTVNLDFGTNAFTNGAARFLEISVRAGASTGAFTTLAPRQEVTSAPFSIQTLKATSADSLSNSCVLCVTDAKIQSIDASKVTGTVSSAVTANNVSGVVAITNGGTGSSTQNFVDLSSNQTNIGGNKTYTGAVGVTGGSGVFNGNGAGLTNLNGANITNNSVTSAQLSADALPNNNSLRLLGSLRWDLLKGQRDIAVGNAPNGAAFDGANIWVVNTNGNTVTKIRASDGATLGTFSASISGPQFIAFDGANMWITNFTSSNNVVKMRANDGVVIGTFSVPTFASAIAFDGANMWIQNGNNVTKLRASDGANLGTFPVGNFPLRIAFDGANIWTTNFSNGNVTKLRAGDGTNLGTFPVSGAVGIVFDGSNMWVVNSASGILVKLRATDGANLGSFPVPAGANDVAFDGTNLWVSNANTPGTVTKIRASDGAVLGTFSVGNSPRSLAFDGTNMWVTNQSSNTVTVLPPAFPQN